MARTLVISINASWNILNFRLGLIAALREQGWRVVALSPADRYSARLAGHGIEHVPIAIDSAGLSPLRDLKLLRDYRRRLRRIRPDAFLGYTAKPNVWGSLAAGSLGIPVISNISGLGTAFIEPGPLRRILSFLYRIALRRSAAVFFQNPDDRALFLAARLVRPDQARLLPGSGIDLDHFRPPDSGPGTAGRFTFLMIGRLLWQKGVREYAEAARIVRRAAPDTRFGLLGFLDAPNRSAVPREQIDAWAGLIDYLGDSDDVRPHIAAADCIVLPSWREGLPRALLEGAAMGRPLIATDAPGCREVVEQGVNGLLCAVRDEKSLAEAMLNMIRLTAAERAAMGAAGRARVERDYGEQWAIAPYLQLLDELVPPR